MTCFLPIHCPVPGVVSALVPASPCPCIEQVPLNCHYYHALLAFSAHIHIRIILFVILFVCLFVCIICMGYDHKASIRARIDGMPVLACTLACQHASTPSCGMLACWSMASQRGRGRRMRMACLCCWPAPQHASTLVVDMLACCNCNDGDAPQPPAAQADQHASTQHVNVHQHAEVACLSVVLVCTPAPSTRHPAPCHFGVHP